jgi:hypothetical protein
MRAALVGDDLRIKELLRGGSEVNAANGKGETRSSQPSSEVTCCRST